MAQDGLDELDEESAPFVASVREHLAGPGYHLTSVFPTADGRRAAVLLAGGRGHPELVLYGLDQEDSSTILVALAEAIRTRDVRARADRLRDVRPGGRVPGDPARELRGPDPLTIMFHRGFDFPALQVVTPDEVGRFPWDPGCDPDVAAGQPLLGPPPVSSARRA